MAADDLLLTSLTLDERARRGIRAQPPPSLSLPSSADPGSDPRRDRAASDDHPA